MNAAIARYPQEHQRSAAMSLLHLWQEHFGFISDEAVVWIAAKLGLEPINILELVTFYPMFRQKPAGKTHIRVCRTLSSPWLADLVNGKFMLPRLESSANRKARECMSPFPLVPMATTASSSLNALLAAARRLFAW